MKQLLLLACAAIITLGMLSCNNDDDNQDYATAIVGTWKWDATASGLSLHITFTSVSTWSSVTKTLEGSSTGSGTYTINDDRILFVEGASNYSWRIVSIGKKKAVFVTTEGIRMTFTK